MRTEYHDSRITCTEDEVQIHGYYIPWGTKHIPYRSIRSMQRINLGALTGRARLWGTANPGRWANFDHRRFSKRVGFDLDVGASVKPFVTPDDPDGFERTMHEHLDPSAIGSGVSRSSII
jgi:hypothetical protein